jgi:hypothetical protein
MERFHYTARGIDGRRRAGEVTALSLEEATNRLQGVGAVLNLPEAPVVAEATPAPSKALKSSTHEPWKTPGGTKLVTTPARSGG